MKYKIINYTFIMLLSLMNICNAQEYFYPTKEFQQTVGANIIAEKVLKEIKTANERSVDSNGFILEYDGKRNIRYGGISLNSIPNIGCRHTPLDVKLFTDKKGQYPRHNIVLYSVHYNSLEQECVDGSTISEVKTHNQGSDYLVGYDSAKQEIIYVSGFLFKHRIAKDFNLQISNPESDNLLYFIALKTYEKYLSNIKYEKTEREYLFYTGTFKGTDKKYNPNIDWRIKVNIKDPDVIIYELIKIYNDDFLK